MIVELLQSLAIEAYDSTEDFLTMLQSPRQLSELCYKLFISSVKDERDNRFTASVALEVLAVACRPLGIDELGWAVAIIRKGITSTVETLRRSVDSKRLITLIGCFFARFDLHDRQKLQLRLVHQSLRQLVIQKSPQDWPDLSSCNHSAETTQDSLESREMQLHEALLRGCVRYLLLGEIDDRPLFSGGQQDVHAPSELPFFACFEDGVTKHLKELDEQEEPFDSFDPIDRGFGGLFTYVSCHWTLPFRRCPSASGRIHRNHRNVASQCP